MPRRSSSYHALIIALSAIILVAALASGHWFNAVAGAAGFFLFGDRLIGWFISSKTGLSDQAANDRIDASLAVVLAKLETTRESMAEEIGRRIRIRLPACLATGVLAWVWLQFRHDAPGLIELAAFAASGACVGWIWASASLSEQYRRLYKGEVLPLLAESFGALTYRRAQDVDIAGLRDSRLFPTFDTWRAEDEIVGHYRGVPLSIVELRLDRSQGDETKSIFDGLLTSITLPRGLSGSTAVISEHGMFSALRDQMMRRGERISLEDPAFEARYKVFGTDQIGARALLTPAFMERFLRLGVRTGFGDPVALARDNRLTIALPKSGFDDLFEPPSYDRPAASRAALEKLQQDVAAVLDVAEAVLDLDWSVRARDNRAVAQ